MNPTNPLRCIAIDDEPPALEVIKKFCERKGGINLKTFSNPNEGLEAIVAEKPQLVFLDIEMDALTGLDIASRLPAGTFFIFTTAYLEYALSGFELDAVDYLHKPFSYTRFETALEKASRRIQIAAPPADNADSATIVVKQEYNNIVIPLDQIMYVEAMEGYSKIFRSNGVCTVSRVILKTIGAMLPPDEFVRIHRSFIVSRNKIRSFTRQNIILTDGTTLPVGRQYAPSVAEIMAQLRGAHMYRVPNSRNVK